MQKPLATRMRPTTITDIVGQDHLLTKGKMLNRMVKSKSISSIILYGKPGIGKTSIAHALSNDLNIPFKYFNAGVHAKKDLQTITKDISPENPVIVLIDEVHRLTKPLQDFLLMYIEEGSLIMVGATTENPYISMNPALRSRSSIFELNPVDTTSIITVLKKALNDSERGLGNSPVNISDECLTFIADQSNGDVRMALNSLDLAVASTPLLENKDGNKTIHINQDIINTCMQRKDIGGDKDGDNHYNLLSAFQKSIRGSDVDASLHYLARLIEVGDIISIMRRLLVISYEDIGLADPSIHTEVLNAVTACERVGLPEARIPLSYITIRLAISPKSNIAYKGIDNAIQELSSNKDLSIPKWLHDTHYKGATELGKGMNYKYPHDYMYGITDQNYLPDDFKNDKYLKFRDEEDTVTTQNRYKKLNIIKNKS